MSEYEREMWEELYAIRSRVESIEVYLQQVVGELMKINRTLLDIGGGSENVEELGKGKSALSALSDKFKRKGG